ncbi:hypothetical protein JCM5353_003164 [Sporobolomyces roseus]
MHSAYSRVSNAGYVPSFSPHLPFSAKPPSWFSRALATTVLLTLLALISSTTFIIPSTLNPDQTSLKINSLNVVQGRSQSDRSHQERDFAFLKFDLKTDVKPLFNWNTKQVFLSLVADYSTPSHPDNSVVLWDRILTSSRQSRINIQEGRQKYEFKTPSTSFGNGTAVYSLWYQVQPHVGVLTQGEIVRTGEIGFPPARRRSQ